MFSKYTSASQSEAQSLVSRYFEPHRLTSPRMGPLDFSFEHFRLSHDTSLSRSHYGAKVNIFTQQLDGTLMVQLPLSGVNEVSLADQRICLEPGQYSVLGVADAIAQNRTEDCEMLIFRIKFQRIERYLSQTLNLDLSEKLYFNTPWQRCERTAHKLRRLAEMILDDALSGKTFPLLQRHYEETLIATLLYEHEHSYSWVFEQGARDKRPDYLIRAEAFMREKAQDELSTEMIARAVGVTARSLQMASRKHLGKSPKDMLRTIRLERAREDLLSGMSRRDSVTNIAYKWGFSHLGYFARCYNERFGEMPSDTLKRVVDVLH